MSYTGMFYRGMFYRSMFRGEMLHTGERLSVVSANVGDLIHRSAPSITISVVALALLASPGTVLAQHGAGRGQPGSGSKPLVCVHDCLEPNSAPSPEEDRHLQHLMAVQATADQSASFNRLLQDVQAARTRLQTLGQLLQKGPAATASSDATASLDQAIEKARSGNQNFLASLSPAQKSGLKDSTKKVETADSDLDKQRRTFDRALQIFTVGTEPVATLPSANLDNALASFESQELALAREMSIVLPADSQDLAFNLASVKSTIELAGQSIAVTVLGSASRTSAGNGHDQFDLRLVADFSDLQQNITGILRSLLARSPGCGERIEIQHAWLHPQSPASLVVVRLHFERWICPGGGSPMELASGDGTVDVRLTPSIEPNTGPRITSEFGRVEAEGLLRESLLTGSLGDTLREQIAAPFLSAMQKAADLAALPPVAKESASIQKVHFQDAGAGQLSLVLDGQLQLSDEQTKQFASQLERSISAQETPVPDQSQAK